MLCYVMSDKLQSPNKHQKYFWNMYCKKKRQSGMSKTKLQGMMINKIVVFWQTHVLIFAVIDHKTTNISEISQVFMVLSEFHSKIH